MAVANPIVSLGYRFGNQAFAYPAASGNLADGWLGTDTGLSFASVYTDSPQGGHPRVQDITFVASAGHTAAYVYSPPSVPGMGIVSAATKMVGVLHYKATGIGTGGRLFKLQIRYYTSSDVQVGADQTLFTLSAAGANYASWGNVYAEEATITPPATASHARLILYFEATAGQTITMRVAFAGIGMWNASAGYYTFANKLNYPGTFTQPDRRDDSFTNANNQIRRLDRDQWAQPNLVNLAMGPISNAMKLQVEYAHRANKGRMWESTYNSNPGGGNWPVILIGGNEVLPYVALYDFAGPDHGLRPHGRFYSDPPMWTGVSQLREIV